MSRSERGGEQSGAVVIAIDGPSGTGKSTVAKDLARRLHAGYLDTGAMYRIVTLAMLRAGIDPADEMGVADHLPLVWFTPPTDADDQHHDLDGDDVTDQIRGGDVTVAVTPVSANPAVRQWLLERQQQLAHSGRMVVEGRDIGTVIAPDAVLKVYLTADETERARRRHRQNTHTDAATNSGPTDLEAVRADLNRRDVVDSTRSAAPLRAAEDAVHLDTSRLTVEEVVGQLLLLAAERGVT